MTEKRSMRELMPATFGWLQDLRAAFGNDAIDPQIRGALADGLPTFYASEGGHTAGVRPAPARHAFSVAELVLESVKPEGLPRGRR